MRLRHLLVPVFAVALVASACGGDDDDDAASDTTEQTDGGGAELGEDTGTVNLMSPGEPNEVEAYQEIFDELINAETDYKVEIESVARLRRAVPDPRRGRHARRRGGAAARCASPSSADAGDIVSLEDLGFDIDELNDAARRVVRRARRVRRRALRPAHEHQPQEHGLVPEGRLRRGRLRGAGDVGRPDRAQRPDRRRRQHAVVHRASRAEATRGGRQPTGWKTSCSAPRGLTSTTSGYRHEIPFNDDAVKTAGERFGEILFTDGYVLGGAPSTARHAFADAPLPMFDDPPGCLLHRQASFINAEFPEGRRSGRRLRLVPAAAHRPGGHALRGRAHRRRYATAPGRRSSTSSSGSSPRTCSARWAACVASSRISPNVERRAGLLRQRHPR